ncbi:hypothetical protein KHM83_15505 [Fusibacter paucivorans]|uniref:Membrane-anchored protein n=1 Tax=Fusibacter paucivorans TaxID=76009 RepID=A0ABS5PVD8_9FIRM|nr:hypothetical protein [Fusibacter paucivorans]MBS7528092.1 hypothetical protein [Fusibacter paucivorans]
MKQAQISKAITRHILPFRFENDFETLDTVFSNDQRFVPVDDVLQGSTKIHDYIKQNLKQENNILKKFKCVDNGTLPHFFPVNKRRKDFFVIEGNAKETGHEKYVFNIDQVELYLFHSGMGFLVTTYDIRHDDLDLYIGASYFLQALKTNKLRSLEYHEKKGKDDFEVSNVDLFALFDAVLSPLTITSFLEDGGQEMKDQPSVHYPVEALVFATVLLTNTDGPIAETERRAYLLGKGYKHSYNCSEQSVEASLIKHFDNLMWSVSREGIANISVLGEDSTTNTFLENSFAASNPLGIANLYFYIYLMILNQRFTLIHIGAEINNKMRGRDFQKHKQEIRANLIKIRSDIAALMLTGVYMDISNNSLYHRFYLEVQKTLGIDALLKELEFEITGLDAITDILNQEEDKVKEQRIKQITELGPFLAVLLGGGDLADLICKLLDELHVPYGNLPITTIVFGALLIGAFLVYRKIKGIEKD